MEKNRIAVVICSCGRPKELGKVLEQLVRQTRPADEIVLVVTQPSDLPCDIQYHLFSDIQVIFSEKGLTRQRNQGLAKVCATSDFVFFMDDDYWPSCYALSGLILAFKEFRDINALNGILIFDGESSFDKRQYPADDQLDYYERSFDNSSPKIVRDGMIGLYGCNMAFRTSAISDIWFDEVLPLYGWQEDVDFSARVPGRKIQTDAICGVHFGTRVGRETSGFALGYSQLANVVHLLRKGTLPWTYCLRLMCRHFAINHLRAFIPEPLIDRRARAAGNRLALRDLLLGKIHPSIVENYIDHQFENIFF